MCVSHTLSYTPKVWQQVSNQPHVYQGSRDNTACDVQAPSHPGTVGMAEHSMPIGELGGKSDCQRILGIIGLAKLASTSVLAVITSAEKVRSLRRCHVGW